MAQEYPIEENIGFFIIDYSTGGGVERVTANLMHQFFAKGFTNLHLVSLKQDLEFPAMNYPPVKSLTILNKKKFAQDLTKYLIQQNIKHLIFQADNMTIALEVLKATKEANRKAYPQYHGSPYAYLKKYPDALKANTEKILFAKLAYPFKKNKLKKFIRHSEQGVFCVSKGSANELKTIFKNDKALKNKIKVIRNPVLLGDYYPAEKEKVITLVSRLERKHKNAFLAVKSWGLIAKEFPDWKLKILGDGSLKDKMMAFCNTHSVHNIEFCGFISEVNSELAKSSISMNVSDCEGFPMAVAEAIVQRNAMVSTNSDGGAKDMLIDDKTALVSPKNDAEALAHNIKKLILNDALRKQLAEQAYHHLVKLSEQDAVDFWLKECFGR